MLSLTPGLLTGLLVCLLVTVSAYAQTPRDAEARLISSKEYTLPDKAKRLGIDGKIVVNLMVDETGKAKDVIVVAGPAWPCGQSSVGLADVRRDVRQTIAAAKFSPAIKKGKPVDSYLALTFAIGDAYRRAVKQREAEEAAKRGENPQMVNAGVVNGKAISLPKPRYPSGVGRIAGTVPVEVLISPEGRVVLAGAIGGHPYLHEASRDAACSAQFSPTLVNGKPVKVTGVITYNFVP